MPKLTLTNDLMADDFIAGNRIEYDKRFWIIDSIDTETNSLEIHRDYRNRRTRRVAHSNDRKTR
jgi:hypothetical protein